MNGEVQEFLTDGGSIKLTGWKIAEIRKNDVAIMAIACDYRSCSALHFHIVVEEETGELVLITTMDTTNDESIARNGFLFRVLSKLVYNNTDLVNVTPREQDPPRRTAYVLPGTPWGQA